MLTWKKMKFLLLTWQVLILILMECSLGEFEALVACELLCLNPYSNGMLTWDEAYARKCCGYAS